MSVAVPKSLVLESAACRCDPLFYACLLNQSTHVGLHTIRGRVKRSLLFFFLSILGSSPWVFTSYAQVLSPQFIFYKHENAYPCADIQAPKAWKIQEGNRDIVVAIVDTGIDGQHPNLKDNLWKHPSAPGSGWDFVNNRPQLNDEHGHGTHIAGIIGSVIDANHGVSGVAHRVSLMSLKYSNLDNMILAIRFAIQHGARIINYSGGGAGASEEERAVIREAGEKGILFVAAGGNEHQDTDQKGFQYFPASYGLSNMISVVASDSSNRLVPFSNWGKHMDVAAPGNAILSTWPNGKFRVMSGTSQSTAFVSGLAVLLLSQNPHLTPQALKGLILDSVDQFPELQGKVATGGRVNAYSALKLLEQKMNTLALQKNPILLADLLGLGQSHQSIFR